MSVYVAFVGPTPYKFSQTLFWFAFPDNLCTCPLNIPPPLARTQLGGYRMEHHTAPIPPPWLIRRHSTKHQVDFHTGSDSSCVQYRSWCKNRNLKHPNSCMGNHSLIRQLLHGNQPHDPTDNLVPYIVEPCTSQSPCH